MDEHQLHGIVLRVTGSDDLEELRQRRHSVIDLLNSMSTNPGMNSDDLRSRLEPSSLFRSAKNLTAWSGCRARDCLDI